MSNVKKTTWSDEESEEAVIQSHEELIPPPYTQAVRANDIEHSLFAETLAIPRGKSIASTLADVQRLRVHNLIKSTIEPLLASYATSGLLKRTFALIPSDVASLQHGQCFSDVNRDNENSENCEASNFSEVVGFPEEECVTLVRLHGHDNDIQFWQQPDMISDLDTELRTRLGIQRDADETPHIISEPVTPVQKKRFFSRKAATVSDGNSRSAQAGTAKAKQAVSQTPGELSLRVSLEEIWIRRPTDMGLYETRSGRALLIRVHLWRLLQSL